MLKKITDSVIPAILIGILLIAHLGQVIYNIGILFFLCTVLYAPLLFIKNISRLKQSKRLSSKLFLLIFCVLTVLVWINSIVELCGLRFIHIGPFGVLLLFVLLVDVSEKTFLKITEFVNPTLSFVLAFAGIIMLGALMLLLPTATTKGITFIDALFTATSAVCVTGLAVLDTGKDFTYFGQTLILLLIQAGGLGILAFTNLFGLLFKGGSTFKDLIFLQELVSADNLQSTLHHLIKIVAFVFTCEMIGAVFILLTASEQGVFFAIFHAVSAFCNAGFSTLTNSLYEPDTRFNYPLHLVVAFTIIVGGIGYNVFFNAYLMLKYHFYKLLKALGFELNHKDTTFAKWDVNSILVLRTTLILIVAGWFLFFIFEYNNTLAEHGLLGKIVGAFFGSITPRTAGFNTIDTSTMLNPTIMITLLLMWIGASPGSTGGGIKTTTFALASLNLWNLIKGKEKLVVYKRNIAFPILTRIAAIISLSLIAIGLSVCIIISVQPELPVMHVAFESFSAFATVGLSLGITAKLTVVNKIVIITLMFLGRVGFLTFLIAIFTSSSNGRNKNGLDYPEGKIYVN